MDVNVRIIPRFRARRIARDAAVALVPQPEAAPVVLVSVAPPPAPGAFDGSAADPGDLTLIFDNHLI